MLTPPWYPERPFGARPASAVRRHRTRGHLTPRVGLPKAGDKPRAGNVTAVPQCSRFGVRCVLFEIEPRYDRPWRADVVCPELPPRPVPQLGPMTVCQRSQHRIPGR